MTGNFNYAVRCIYFLIGFIFFFSPWPFQKENIESTKPAYLHKRIIFMHKIDDKQAESDVNFLKYREFEMYSNASTVMTDRNKKRMRIRPPTQQQKREKNEEHKPQSSYFCGCFGR